MSGTIGRRGLLIGGGALAATPVIGAGPRRRPAGAARRVRTGLHDVVAAEDWPEFRGQRVGVITNPTGVLSVLISIVDADAWPAASTVVGVFGPEHGFRGAAQAGGSRGHLRRRAHRPHGLRRLRRRRGEVRRALHRGRSARP